jgi:hypothetical protein
LLEATLKAHAGRWRGSVVVERFDHPADQEGLLRQWGGHGCRLGNLLLFGDARLVARLRQAFRP